jgi:hypothetical protein
MDPDLRYLLFILLIVFVFGELQALFNVIGISIWLLGLSIEIAVKFFPLDLALLIGGLIFGFFMNKSRRRR